MKKMRSNLLLIAVCAGTMLVACSENSDDVAGGAVEDMGIVARLDTVFVHDSIKVKVKDTVKVKVKDTVVVKDTVNKSDTVIVKDTVNSKDTVVVKDTVNTKDTVVVRDTVSSKDTAYIFKKGTVSGIAQKGPFVKGSSVKLFELDGKDSLKQTGRSFSDSVSSNDGSFKIKNVSVVSPYVQLTVTGAFRQELDGKKSGSSVTLRALSKVGGSNTTVNVNLITHLEYDRVAYLLKKNPRMDLSEAKSRAEKEIFAIFNIDADSFGYSEDLNIFGTEDANAALLAVSVMLSSNYSAKEVMDRLAALSADLAEDGTWDNKDALDSVATWAKNADLDGTLSTIRENILAWKVGEDVPDFEKYVRKFWREYLGLGDEFEEGKMYKSDTGSTYVFDNGDFRLANSRELYLNSGCTKQISKTLTSGFSKFSCKSGQWEFVLDTVNTTMAVDSRDTTFKYKTVAIGKQVWIRKNVSNIFQDPNYCSSGQIANCIYDGMTVRIHEALDGPVRNDSAYMDPSKGLCGGKTLDNCVLKEEHQGVCPDGFHIPRVSEFQELVKFVDMFNGDEKVAWSLRASWGWNDTKGKNRFGFDAYAAPWVTYDETTRQAKDNIEQASMLWVMPESKNNLEQNAVYFRISQDSVSFKQFDTNKHNLLYVRCVKNRKK